MAHRSRRKLLQSSVALAGISLLPSYGFLSAGATQPNAKVPRIGVLFPSPPASGRSPNIDAFLEGMREHGYVEGHTAAIEWRFADKDHMYRDLAVELVQLKVDVIVTAGTPAALAAKRATTTIPIVMASSGDPVGSAIIASLARPGGNVTGLSSLTSLMDGKRLSLLRELLPGITRVAILSHPTNPLSVLSVKAMQASAVSLGIQLQVLDVKEPDEFATAFRAVLQGRAEALMELPDNFFATHQARILEFAAQHRLVAMHQSTEFVASGGLMAYGPNLPDLYRRSADYVDKILKGVKPADLPVEQPARFDFVINLRTAHALGLTIPQSIRLQTTQLIEN
jgi:putative tryptophan/tyrosine transport system substrate-binding protein